ncbi:MAG: hypothetical protein ACFB00_13565 [Parvularculaceae bacterium]
MPYGVKRGVKAPGEFGVADVAGLALAGSAGIISALVTDFQAKGESSALFTLNHWAASHFDMFGLGNPPLWLVVAGLVAAGAGSVFYFQPITRQGAFAQGVGLLAVLMTFVPPELGAGLTAPDEDLPGLQSVSANFDPSSQKIDARPRQAGFSGGASADGARVIQAQSSRRVAQYVVEMRVTFPGGFDENVTTLIRRGMLRGRLHNESTKQTYNLFRNAGGNLRQQGNTLIIRAGVPARSETTRLWVRIECEGHASEEQSAVARIDETLRWNITMRESTTPMFIQRLNKSFWF